MTITITEKSSFSYSGEKFPDYLHPPVAPYYEFQVRHRLAVCGEEIEEDDDEEFGQSMWNRSETYRWDLFQPLVQSYFVHKGGFAGEGSIFYWLEGLQDERKRQLKELAKDYRSCCEQWDEDYEGVREDYDTLLAYWNDEFYGRDSETKFRLGELTDKWERSGEDKSYHELGYCWDYSIQNKCLTITLILTDYVKDTPMDTREVEAQAVKDCLLDYAFVYGDYFGDLEDLDDGRPAESCFAPYEISPCSTGALLEAKEADAYVLTRFLWNKLRDEVWDWEGEHEEWRDGKLVSHLTRLNNETQQLCRYLEHNPNQDDEELDYPGLGDKTISYYASLMGFPHKPVS